MELKEEKIYIYIHKITNFLKQIYGLLQDPNTSKTKIFPTLVHGRKPLNNVTKSIIPGLVGVPKNLWNIINKIQISFNRITEKILKKTHTHTQTHKPSYPLPTLL